MALGNVIAVLIALAGLSCSVLADERRAAKEEYDDGACKIERKWESNGDYKEDVKCEGKGAFAGPEGGLAALGRRDAKEEFDDGACSVKRKWEANGGYKEETRCRGR